MNKLLSFLRRVDRISRSPLFWRCFSVALILVIAFQGVVALIAELPPEVPTWWGFLDAMSTLVLIWLAGFWSRRKG